MGRRSIPIPTWKIGTGSIPAWKLVHRPGVVPVVHEVCQANRKLVREARAALADGRDPIADSRDPNDPIHQLTELVALAIRACDDDDDSQWAALDYLTRFLTDRSAVDQLADLLGDNSG